MDDSFTLPMLALHSPEGGKFWVNADKITAVFSYNGGAEVHLMGPAAWRVTESAEDVLQKLGHWGLT